MPDYKHQGKQMWSYKAPPMINGETVLIFQDSLLEIANQKIKELLPRYQYIDMRNIYPLEKRVILKWLVYWQKLKRRVLNKEVPRTNAFDIETLKAIPFTDILGIPVRHISGKSFFLCPFHQERTASFIVFPNNHAKCFGCGWSGSIIDYVMETEKLSFVEACRRLNVTI